MLITDIINAQQMRISTLPIYDIDTPFLPVSFKIPKQISDYELQFEIRHDGHLHVRYNPTMERMGFSKEQIIETFQQDEFLQTKIQNNKFFAEDNVKAMSLEEIKAHMSRAKRAKAVGLAIGERTLDFADHAYERIANKVTRPLRKSYHSNLRHLAKKSSSK